MKKPYFIAEMSCNHNGNIENAFKIIDGAAWAGADAIKLQTFTADGITLDCDNEYFRVKDNPLWLDRLLFELYQEAETPWKWHKILKRYAELKGLDFISTPFQKDAVDFLESIQVEAYKISSFMIENIPLLKHIAKTKKPVYMSTGACSYSDITYAIKVLSENGCSNIHLLHCVSAYPTPLEDVNLRRLNVLKNTEGCFGVGLSDHTRNFSVGIGAFALGARIFENHLKVDDDAETLDAEFSFEPIGYRDYIRSIKELDIAMGSETFDITDSEKESLQFKTSVFITKDIEKGEFLTEENIKIVRPGYGLSPRQYEEVLGMKAKNDLKRGNPLRFVNIA